MPYDWLAPEEMGQRSQRIEPVGDTQGPDLEEIRDEVRKLARAVESMHVTLSVLASQVVTFEPIAREESK